MQQLTVPDDAVVDGDDVWWTVDGELLTDCPDCGDDAERATAPGPGEPWDEFDCPGCGLQFRRSDPPAELVAFTEPCQTCEGSGCDEDWCRDCGDEYEAPCVRHIDCWHGGCECGSCQGCVDGEPLVELVRTCKGTLKPHRNGLQCDGGCAGDQSTPPTPGFVSLGVGTVEVLPVVADDDPARPETPRVAIRRYDGLQVLIWPDRARVSLAAELGQYVVHWKRAG